MVEDIQYNNIKGSQVIMSYDGRDYEVKLNGAIIMTTGDEIEASMIAEAIDTALSILSAQELLKSIS